MESEGHTLYNEIDGSQGYLGQEAKVRRQQLTAAVVTLLLAIPFAALALVVVAWIDDNLARLVASLAAPQVDWQAIIREAWSRWPEVLGMLIGQALIVIILVLAREAAFAEKKG